MPAALTIYSRPGCHLCEEMKALVERVAGAQTPPPTIEIVDISTDPDLEERYGVEIPVLMINGTKAAKFRVSEEEITRILRSRDGERAKS